MDANHSHVFWLCPGIRPYWEEVMERIRVILNYDFPRDPQLVFLGLLTEETIHEEDWYLFKILTLAAKKAITRKWLDCVPPRLADWEAVVKEIQSMEDLTAQLRMRVETHKRRWLKWFDHYPH